ncbi:MAG: arsenite efflux transporter metallochaperone ArsD [Phycisphaerales bacterium]|nr:arsenite efflux transporter metallochaperone ArsD [Phycisphaerales bacterium]
MKTLEVYDPPMCCSTGVCGPAVDPKLAQFAADLEWLGEQGASVTRFGLTGQPEAYAANELVRQSLTESGQACLPLILTDGQIATQGTYPQREELAKMVGLDTAPTGGCCTPVPAEQTGGCCGPASTETAGGCCTPPPAAPTGGCCGSSDSDSQCC